MKWDNTFFLDADYNQRSRPDEIKLSDTLGREARRREIPLEIKDLNSQGYGDCMFVGLDGVYSAEIKKAGEYIGDVDHCIKQLKGQIPNADFANVFIYGEMESSPDGKSYSLDFRQEHLDWERHPDSQISRSYRRRYHNVNWQAQRKILWRFRQEGIQVIETRNLEELAFEMCNWYECANTVGTTFTRLIPEKFNIRESDKQRADFMLTLMGIQGAGIGEEIADAIASWMEVNVPLTLAELINALPQVGDTLTSQPLRSSLLPGARKRTIGPAAVVKLKKALGVI